MRQTKVLRGYVADALQRITSHKNVRQSVIAVIEKPGRETENWLGHSCCRRHLGKVPGSFGVFVGVARTIVAEEHVRLPAAGEIKIRQTVAVKIRARHALDKRQMVNARFSRAFGESAIAIVAVKFERARRVGFSRFVANEKIKPAVVVKVEPDRGLGGMKAQQASLLGDVVESAVAVVAQERIGVTTALATPCSAQHQNIREPVVVARSMAW